LEAGPNRPIRVRGSPDPEPTMTAATLFFLTLALLGAVELVVKARRK
jgi:hypothetical protein